MGVFTRKRGPWHHKRFGFEVSHAVRQIAHIHFHIHIRKTTDGMLRADGDEVVVLMTSCMVYTRICKYTYNIYT